MGFVRPSKQKSKIEAWYVQIYSRLKIYIQFINLWNWRYNIVSAAIVKSLAGSLW